MKAEYEKKLISAEEAAKLIKNDMFVELGGAVSFASVVDKYLAQRKSELSNVNIGTFIDILPYEFLRVDPMQEVFKWHSGFLHMSTRPFSKELGVCMYQQN